MIWECHKRLAGITHNALSCTDAVEIVQLKGEPVRELLSGGCGFDLRPRSFSVGSCRKPDLRELRR